MQGPSKKDASLLCPLPVVGWHGKGSWGTGRHLGWALQSVIADSERTDFPPASSLLLLSSPDTARKTEISAQSCLADHWQFKW